MANLGLELGRPCQQNWQGSVSSLDPRAQLSQASAVPVGEGWLQPPGSVRNAFQVICLKGVYVIAPRDTTRILRLLEPSMAIAIPWSTRSSSFERSWCGPSYVCTQGSLPSQMCGGRPWTSNYGESNAQGVCLPQYDYTQRPNGQASSYCWNQSNNQWAAFWLEVGAAVRRLNA